MPPRKLKLLPKLLNWSITAWQMNGQEGWTTQPVILVEGRKPFYADTPEEYIAELERLHDDPALLRLQTLYAIIGQLKDAREYSWQVNRETRRASNGKNSADSLK